MIIQHLWFILHAFIDSIHACIDSINLYTFLQPCPSNIQPFTASHSGVHLFRTAYWHGRFTGCSDHFSAARYQHTDQPPDGPTAQSTQRHNQTAPAHRHSQFWSRSKHANPDPAATSFATKHESSSWTPTNLLSPMPQITTHPPISPTPSSPVGLHFRQPQVPPQLLTVPTHHLHPLAHRQLPPHTSPPPLHFFNSSNQNNILPQRIPPYTVPTPARHHNILTNTHASTDDIPLRTLATLDITDSTPAKHRAIHKPPEGRIDELTNELIADLFPNKPLHGTTIITVATATLHDPDPTDVLGLHRINRGLATIGATAHALTTTNHNAHPLTPRQLLPADALTNLRLDTPPEHLALCLRRLFAPHNNTSAPQKRPPTAFLLFKNPHPTSQHHPTSHHYTKHTPTTTAIPPTPPSHLSPPLPLQPPTPPKAPPISPPTRPAPSLHSVQPKQPPSQPPQRPLHPRQPDGAQEAWAASGQ